MLSQTRPLFALPVLALDAFFSRTLGSCDICKNKYRAKQAFALDSFPYIWDVKCVCFLCTVMLSKARTSTAVRYLRGDWLDGQPACNPVPDQIAHWIWGVYIVRRDVNMAAQLVHRKTLCQYFTSIRTVTVIHIDLLQLWLGRHRCHELRYPPTLYSFLGTIPVVKMIN